MQENERRCHDCQTIVSEWVLERRQVSGPGQGDGPHLYAGDFRQLPVCVNRLICQQNKTGRSKTQRYGRKCPLCAEYLVFTNDTERQVAFEHLLHHPQYELLALLWEKTSCGRHILPREEDEGGIPLKTIREYKDSSVPLPRVIRQEDSKTVQ